MKIEYNKDVLSKRFGELSDYTKFVVTSLYGGVSAYIKLGEFFMDSDKVNAFSFDDEALCYIDDNTIVHIPEEMKVVVTL